MERFDGISVFVEVADAGGFSAAAARLNLSRSAVGKTVSRLERRLGVRLFHRTTRTQSLTEEGQLFYESCQKALGEIRTAEDLLESGRREIRGRLRISMPSSSAAMRGAAASRPVAVASPSGVRSLLQ